MITYKAITPTAPKEQGGPGKTDKDGNPIAAFKGITAGVRFEEGIAVFNDAHPKLKRLGLTAAQAATIMVNDFGYQVCVVKDDGSLEPWTPPVQRKKKKPASAKVKVAATAET